MLCDVYFTLFSEELCARCVPALHAVPFPPLYQLLLSLCSFFPDLLSGKALINSASLGHECITRLSDSFCPGLFLFKQEQTYKVMVEFQAADTGRE